MVRERFDRIGDVRTCFDMLEKRGMLFITYVRSSRLPHIISFRSLTSPCLQQFDIRAAMMAKDQLQGSMINGRPVRHLFTTFGSIETTADTLP